MEPQAAIRAIFEQGWNQGDFSSLGGVLATRVVHHSGEDSRVTGLEDLERVVGRWRSGFPDLEFKIRALVASAEVVAAHLTLVATHQGTWAGREPTGRRIEVDHMFFFRFDGGQVVEVWELADATALRKHLGD
jgi:predicted ester cyclase